MSDIHLGRHLFQMKAKVGESGVVAIT